MCLCVNSWGNKIRKTLQLKQVKTKFEVDNDSLAVKVDPAIIWIYWV